MPLPTTRGKTLSFFKVFLSFIRIYINFKQCYNEINALQGGIVCSINPAYIPQ